MKSLHKILAISVLATAAGSAMAADQTIVTDEGVSTFSFFKPAAVRAEVGTTGYGGAISWSANPYVGVTLGYNGGDISWSDDLSINGSKYDLDMDNNLTYLNAEIRPWANWFYMAAGVAYIDNDYEVDRRIRDGETFRVNDVEFRAEGDARINGKMSYKNNIAPYVGIGFSPAITNRWGVFGEIGAYYNGNPTVELTPSGTAVSTDGVIADFGDQVEREERNIRNDNEYEWLPVAKLGVSFRF
ncbi:ornithine uptake porin CarO [Acinetobacter indicus]|uniref:ornithine uptake porin CarO n=1 Tax=Acinetobacter indicus TaxID=756892 RepID=UPI0013638937|nr:ornithine uptake porin CarO [Acinetobacter indicus]